ncbi:MAG: ABC transporter ATP-binding protein [Anaerolineaceae bacterium]|nr:ABC transporter ATP-binding protein [Anaerolineaceae bacterium]
MEIRADQTNKTPFTSLQMRNVCKRFPGVLANCEVDFDVVSGEVHALLGENGAGKSTLMKVLYGMYKLDDGEIILNGQPVTIQNPTVAINHGIGMIHQHFMLVPTLTVAENVALGLPSSKGPLTDLDVVSERIVQLASTYNLKIDPSALIWQLSVGQQQRVEIIKALYRGASLLLLDEPTAVLTPQEVDELFLIMRQMTSDGYGLGFISHKLHEVVEISDRITVLRNGRKIGTQLTSAVTKQTLANWMVGREITFITSNDKMDQGEVRIDMQAVSCPSQRGTEGLRHIDLQIHSGEIVGLAGVSGNGQLELAEVVTGLRPIKEGRVLLDGEDITGLIPGQVTEKGLSYVPEERMKDGMIRDFNISENLILREHHKWPFSKKGFLRIPYINEHTDKLVEQFRIKTPSRMTLAKNLSGGNIQKVLLARELSRSPRAIVAAQPTRGLDIGASEYVHEQLLEQRKLGTAILLISEDLDEIMALADRIAVIYEGQIMDVLPRLTATKEDLGLLMAGVHPGETIQN